MLRRYLHSLGQLGTAVLFARRQRLSQGWQALQQLVAVARDALSAAARFHLAQLVAAWRIVTVLEVRRIAIELMCSMEQRTLGLPLNTYDWHSRTFSDAEQGQRKS